MNQTEVSSQAMLSEAERHKLLVEWNATDTVLPKAACIHELIEQRATESPDTVALICRDCHLTYAQLNARATRVASHLRKLGVGPETLVGICVERSLEMVIGLLGILKSGGAYVPLDPTYPKERLALMVEDSKPLVLITQSILLDLLPQTGSRIVCLDSFEGGAHPRGDDHASRIPHHASLAYVIYTSGSTGKPKGVMVEHGNVLNFFTAMDACIPNGPESSAGRAATGTWLAVTSPSFDISVLELFWTLSRAFKVVLYPGDQAGLVAEEFSIPALIRRHGVTHLQCTPSGANMMLLDEKTRNALGQLQTLLIGGEAFPAKLARDLREVFKGTMLNMYGPTETTVWSTTWQLPANGAPARVPVGRPMANTQVYIVDSNLHPVPVGTEGELLIGGAGVARGYLRREALTADRFIPNPFVANSSAERSASRPGSQQPESSVEVQNSSTPSVEVNALRAGTARAPALAPRLYRTGDLARFLPDGNIELLGRIDNQVKIRGHRVELGEIEALLNEHPGVRESIVLLRDLTNGEKTLIAYIIPREGQKPTPEQLRQYAQQKLPDYMVPGRVMFMTEFPQTPNKKIDRNAFPLPATEANRDQDNSGRPGTATEDALAGLWKELLGLSQAGRDDNFFELGGHSMLAMQLVAKVRKRFKVDFRLKNVFERQTLAGMGEVIEAMSWSDFVKTPRTGEREVVDV
jgi:amino acid adenylation domain-containing protein